MKQSNYYGFFQNHNNIVGASTQFVFMLSSLPAGSYVKIASSNIRRTVSLFTVRRLTPESFINHEDVYIGRDSK